eukprot:gene15946-21636_t
MSTEANNIEITPNNEHEVMEETIQIMIQNIVATVNLEANLDLDKITQTARNAEYNPRKFQAVIMRIREPRVTALIFASGKMIVTGAKNLEDSVNAAKKFTSIIQKVGYPTVRYTNYKIQNMTATCDVGFPIRLEGLIYAHSTNATYEPELFPGLIYRMADPKVVLLIFVSGKIVITGAKDVNSIQRALENIHPHLLEFRKKNLVITSTLVS